MQAGLDRRPAELATGTGRRRDQLGWVTGAARRCFRWHWRAGDLPYHVRDLPVGKAIAVAQVVDPVTARFGRVQGQQVGRGQVLDVDVVPNARTVCGGIVGTEDLQPVSSAGGYLQRDRDEVCLWLVPLAQDAAVSGICRASHVEVPQAHRA